MNTAENTQSPIRKGGQRKIFHSAEERKERKRAAQNNFRHRRTIYISYLETSLKEATQKLENRQEKDRVTEQELVLLRYENSLLQRIIFEKGINVPPELENREKEPPRLGLDVPVSKRGLQQMRNTLDSALLNGTGNTVVSVSGPGQSTHQTHTEQLEKEYDELPCLDVAGHGAPGDQVVGAGPYPKAPAEQPMFQIQVTAETSRPQAPMKSFAVEEPSISSAHTLSTTYQTFTPHHISPAGDPFSHPGHTRFLPHFLLAAPTLGGTTSFPEMTGVGDWMTPAAVHHGGTARVDGYGMSGM